MIKKVIFQKLHFSRKKCFINTVESYLEGWRTVYLASHVKRSSSHLPNKLKQHQDGHQDAESLSDSSKQDPIPFLPPIYIDVFSSNHLKHTLEKYKHRFPADIVESDINKVKSRFSSQHAVVYEELFVKSDNIGDLMWKPLPNDLSPGVFLRLAKIRLTGLVALSAMAGYAMAPGPFETGTFLCLSLGVLLTSSAANSINQFFEVPFDSQMSRTMMRPIVKGSILPHQAVMFAGLTGITGVVLLAAGTNPLTTFLGAFNILLYTHAYTPMKRLSIANTWIGSVVGAIPPVMGWTAATGSLGVGALLMGGLLYCWQFPHFNALSWNLQGDYSRAGYRMMSVVDAGLCKRVSLRYSLLLLSSSLLFPLCDITSWTFAVDSLPPNLCLVYLAWRFHQEGDSSSSRKLFRFTLVHLPILLLLLIISKKHYGASKTEHEKVVAE